ncbi:MAG: T9SS type A sorting domain-containing protein [Bacteroidales bacterium]|nr:T9SS type A sorting domain-containing protein [Bacteroidales bacterium]
MRKCIIITLIGILISMPLFSQKFIFTENFDNDTIRFSPSSTTSWKIDSNFQLSPPNGIRGIVPNKSGDSVILTSPVYNLSNYSYVYLQFDHICKVSPMDMVAIEYRISNQTWKPIPVFSYLGNASSFHTNGFSANSYTQWLGKDSLAYPNASWWKQEVFDLTAETSKSDGVQFRFVIKRGTVSGTQISYGWLLDNIEVVASSYEVRPPLVTFVAPFVRDTVNSTGTWIINAKVKTITAARIENPYLKYTATYLGTVLADDSVSMTLIKGDSLWQAVIPQFRFGTNVVYSITGRDTTNNWASDTSGYVIKKPVHNFGDISVALTSIDTPIYQVSVGNIITPVTVTLRNKGDSVLTSATIYWSVNGVEQTPFPWTGNLMWDFEQQVTLGTYLSRTDDYDTVCVWIVMPNGITDNVLIDDSLAIIVYGCMSMHGVYTVGDGEIFPTITSAITALSFCPPQGNIVIQMKNGVYSENVNLTNSSAFMGKHTLTLTSLTGDKDGVIIRPSSGIGVRLNASNNIRIEDITIDVEKGTHGVYLSGACTNVVINRCNIFANPTATTGTTINAIGIYKPSSSVLNNSAHNVRVANCFVNGGFYGIYFDSFNKDYNDSVSIDSNIVINQSVYGIYCHFTGYTSVSYNQITSRSVDIGTTHGTTWRGLTLDDVRSPNKTPVVNNRIRSNNPKITNQLYGIYNRYVDSCLFANNEIYLNSSATTTYGIWTSNGIEVDYFHNTVLLTGKGGATFRALHIEKPSTATPYFYVYNKFKNNIFVANGGTTPYAIYLPFTPDSNFLHYYQINSNNYYSSGNLGYTGVNRADLAAWKSVIISDSNSTNKLPIFLDTAVDLRISNQIQLYCLPDTLVRNDIRDSVRNTPTQMGCYEFDLFDNNGSLSQFSGMREGILQGVTDSLKIVFTNNGKDTLHSVNLSWSVNGTTQSSKEYFFSKPLSWMETDTLDVATLTYPLGYVNVQIWINSLNGGTLSDEFTQDDTVKNTVYICSGAISGVIPVSNTSNYSTINSLLDHLSICGLGGDVTILLDSGVYTENCDFSFLSKDTLGHKLTLTSKSGKADDVVIKTVKGNAVTLSDVRNLTIKNITLDATVDTTQAILFTGSCQNILIKDCKLLGNLTTNKAKNVLVNTANTGVMDSIFFITNLFNGGYQAVVFKGGIDTSLNGYGTVFIFDSNTVSNQYAAGVNLSYLDSIRFSHNTITPRTTTSSTSIAAEWIALTLSYINGDIIGNRILERNIAITIAHGMEISYHNYYPVGQALGKGLIANNEIILTEGDYYLGIYVCKGMYIENSNSEIIHNSIYTTAVSGAYGLQIYGTTNNISVTNNNIVISGTTSTTSYPIYLPATSQNIYDIDYNNFYAPSYIAYLSGNVTTIDAWKQKMPTDTHSVRVLPNFIDLKTGLELSDNNYLYGNLIPSVSRDINGISRKTLTRIGCYEENIMNANAALIEMSALRNGLIKGETETLKIIVHNRGASSITSINLSLLINGTTETKHECFFTSPLAWKQTDTVDLTLTYIPGNMTVKVWINSFNLETLYDDNPKNDTLSTSTFVCLAPVTDTIRIGKEGDYTNITSALQSILKCGYGNITLLIDSGLYAENCDLTDINRYMSTNKLTITSKSGKASDVVIKPVTGGRMKLSNTRNVVIKNITLDATTATTYGITFAGDCYNILIRDCRFLGNLTSTNTANILVNASTNMSDSIFFISNLFEGGYRAINFKGGIGTGEGQYGTNFIFDSNTLTKQYTAGAVLSYLELISCSHNIISSRATNVSSTWNALAINHSNGPIIGNKITSLSASISYPMGMNISCHHYFPLTKAKGRGLIANNEITLANSYNYMNSSAAIRIDSVKSYIVHNSVHVISNQVDAAFSIFGLLIPKLNSNDVIIKNNNIVINATAPNATSYPIYFADTGSLNLYDMDYNNYYSANYVGYYQQGIKSLTTWKKTTASDMHSVSLMPNYIDFSTGLKFLDNDLFHCDLIPDVNKDINGINRYARTVMGCYEEDIIDINTTLTDILGLDKIAVSTGQNEQIQVVFTNKGHTTVHTAKLKWSINGQLQSEKYHTFTPPLSTFYSDTIDLDILSYIDGEMNIKIWIEQLDGGALIDGDSQNDTVMATVFGCNSMITNILQVGVSNIHKTINEAITAVARCGVGDITIMLDGGLYEENCNFSILDKYLATNTLTITSKTGNATDVIIKSSSEAAIVLSNTRNIVLKKITIDVRSTNNPCILFAGTCTNILVRDCRLLADTSTTNILSAPVYKGAKTGIVDSIFFIGNLLDGGYAGFYFIGGGDYPSEWGSHVIFDSNIISNTYYYGIYTEYTDFISCLRNSITSRRTNTGLDWYGIQINNSKISLIGNSIIQRSNAITKPYGIYSSMHNFNYQDIPVCNRAMIANNEIILNTTITTSNTYSGIYATNTRAEFINNSVYFSGTGAARGIYIDNAKTTKNDLIIQNNNIITQTTYTSQPLQFSDTGNISLYNIDYNNYGTSTYIGYYGKSIKSMLDWQDVIPSDRHSVKILPTFEDSNITKLALSSFTGLACPLYAGVTKDIHGISRTATTSMGAYHGVGDYPLTLNLAMKKIICDTIVSYSQKISVSIEIENEGTNILIDSAVFGWSINDEIQPSFRWIAGSRLGIREKAEVTVGILDPSQRTNVFNIVVWVEEVNGVTDTVTSNNTVKSTVRVLFTGSNLHTVAVEQLVPVGQLCTADSTSLKVRLQNSGTLSHDFSLNPVTFHVRVTTPDTFKLDKVISSGELKSGETVIIELTDNFPIVAAGEYDINVWIDSLSNILYDDTLMHYFISGKFSLPVDEYFDNNFPVEFNQQSNNLLYQWQIIPEGIDGDSVVAPQFGDGMLSFRGDLGSMSTLSTRQLDLSRTEQPSLSFWYFHDTIPNEDYTDVRITVDGGTTYTTLFSLEKYNSVYGWKQYSTDLPIFAVNQCVIIAFEAMEKTRSTDITQYIDRIFITAKQDIAVTDIFASSYSICDLEEKKLNVVLSNLTDPILNYDSMIVTLEIIETGQIFTDTLITGILLQGGADTVTIANGIDLQKGTYTLKAYFSSVFDVDRNNDTLIRSIIINPDISISLEQVSGGNSNCLAAGIDIFPRVNITNTGNMELYNIALTLQIDTGTGGTSDYVTLKDTYRNVIPVNGSIVYDFKNPYQVPWKADYYLRITAYLACDSSLVNTVNETLECADTKDLQIVSIDNLTDSDDKAESSVQLRVSLHNRSDYYLYNDVRINVLVENSQGIATTKFDEIIGSIGTLSTVSHEFTNSYTVPNDTVYYLTVYIDSNDIYQYNDTIKVKRATNYTNINTTERFRFTVNQNIPNPADDHTHIDYSIPESGEVLLYVHSISGQLLYSQHIDAKRGNNSIELRTDRFSSGIYFYSMEYRGQKQIKQLIIM